MAGVEGLEPPAHGLEIRCSIHLSYTPNLCTFIYLRHIHLMQIRWSTMQPMKKRAVFRFRKRVW